MIKNLGWEVWCDDCGTSLFNAVGTPAKSKASAIVLALKAGWYMKHGKHSCGCTDKPPRADGGGK
jgi:hypothetical protein